MTFENFSFSPLNAPAPDIGDTPATARALDVGETVSSTFEEGDNDMFAVTLEAGKIYAFSFDYADGSSHTILNYHTFQPYIYRYTYNPDTDRYTRVREYESEGANIPLMADVTDTYYIRAHHHSWTINEPVDYTFTVNEITDDHGGTTAEATAIEVGADYAGNIDYRYDDDVLSVTLNAGQEYIVSVAPGDGDGLDYIPTQILNADGNVVAERNLNATNMITFTASESGTYYLWLDHKWGEGEDELSLSHSGEYTVQISEPPRFIGDDTDERFDGTQGNDYFETRGGNDKVYTRKGNDVVHLGDGNDYVRVGGGREEFHGGAGKDYISYYDSTNGVTINLATNKVSGSWAANDIISGFESVSGSKNGHDKIYGTSGANTIRTYGGNDKVYAGKGSDKVYLGDGNDYVKAGGGKEEFHGGNGTDYLSYYDSSNGVNINLATNEVSGSWAVNDIISGFENVSGSKTGHDTIYGTSGANKIKTYGGNDKIYAGGGNDKVYAGGGDDIVSLGSGNDYVKAGGGKESFDGGSGHDYISYYDSKNGVYINLDDDIVSRSWAENDTIKNFESASGSNKGHDEMVGSADANTLKGNGGNDSLYGRGGNDKLYGGRGSDRIYGSDGDDTIYGDTGSDNLYGGNDRLFGSEGNDVIFGEKGNDTIDGDAGNDLLTSGTGWDVFHFDFGDGNDTITDFEDDVDTLQLDNFRDTDGDGNIALIFGSQWVPGIELRFDNGQTLTIDGLFTDQINDDIVQM